MISHNFARKRCLVLAKSSSPGSAIKAILSTLGYTVDVETDRKMGMSSFLIHRHSLVLIESDFLPRHPYRLMQMFKMAHRAPGILIFTRDENDALEYSYLKDGIFEVIQVPFRAEKLIATVKRIGYYLRLRSCELFFRDLLVHVGLCVPVLVLLAVLLVRG